MREKRKLSEKKQCAFVADGECEHWYLQMLKRNERGIRVTFKPEIPQKKSVSEQYDKVIELIEDYTYIFWIVDLDVVLPNKTESNQLKGCIGKLKKFTNVVVILNNPCLEFWFLLHFQDTVKFYESFDKLKPELQKYLKDYEKTEKYYIQQNNDIYKRLRPFLSNAMQNSKKYQSFDLDDFHKGISEMHKLFSNEIFQPILNDKR